MPAQAHDAPTAVDRPSARPLTRREQLKKLVRDCRYRLDPSKFSPADTDNGGPRKRRKRVPQVVSLDQIASRSGYSYAWHSLLERGSDEGYSDDFLTIVAEILEMTSDETDMLFSLAGRHRVAGPPEQDLSKSRVIQWTLDENSCPAFVLDSAWDVLAYNDLAAEWFSWAQDDRPNFMRWAFTTVEARTVLHNWDKEWGPQLWAEMQVALARQPENTKLKALISEILKSSQAAREISENPLSYINPDGRRRRVKVPALGNRIRVVEQLVLAPLRAPASRIVIIVPLDEAQH